MIISLQNRGLFFELLYILIVIMASSKVECFSAIGRNRQLNCPASTDCECRYEAEFEISCPKRIDPKIVVRVEPHWQNNRVEIECNTDDDKVYTILPKWDIGDSYVVKFISCPLTAGTSIKHVVDRLGINKVPSVSFLSRAEISIERQHLTGLKTMKHLGLNGLNTTNLPEDLFDDVNRITSLDLRSNKMHLPVNIFQNLRELEFLELGFNNLSKLEEGVLRNQNKLKRLNLWGNNLRSLTKETFAGASSVIELDLSSNNIELLKPDVFKHFINVTTINLNANRIISLPESLFMQNKKLKRIRMTVNRIDLDSLPKGFLANLPMLEEVIINCNIRNVPEDLFSHSINLRNITMASNGLIEIPRRLFGDQKNLLELDLSYNRLAKLSNGLFSGAQRLTILRLSHNQIRKISRNLISGLSQLHELYLDNNGLHMIDMGAFDGTNLQFLYLQDNHLEFINIEQSSLNMENVSPFYHLNRLKVLNLQNNSIEYFLNDWHTNNLALRELDLSHNRISSIDFSNMLNLWIEPITVNLSQNLIKTIICDRNLSKSVRPKSTWILNYNPLKCDCIILHFVRYLRGEMGSNTDSHLNLVTNNLKCASPARFAHQLPEKISPTELICSLDSENGKNKLCPNRCTCFVRTADSTSVFNCSNAGLVKMPILPDINDLGLKSYELHIENNNINALPMAYLAGFQNVSKIFARNNSIQSISAENLPSTLVTLDLSENKLQKLSANMIFHLTRMQQLQNISLAHNPWLCDCDAYGLLQFFKSHSRRLFDFNLITCNNGEILINAKNDLCPVENSFTIMLIYGALIALILFCIIFCYKYQQEINVWIFAHNHCKWFLGKNQSETNKTYDAFIIHSLADGDFVGEELVPELEKGPQAYKVCMFYRAVGSSESETSEKIAKYVEISRRTIVVLSPNLIEHLDTSNVNYSENSADDRWGLVGFRVAHKIAFDQRSRVIVIIYGNIGDAEKFTPEIKAYLNTNIYLKWGDRGFFNKLRYALAFANSYKSRCLTAAK